MTTEIHDTGPQQPAQPQPAAHNYLPPEPLYELQRQLAVQARRIAELEARLPQTKLVSPKFLTRAFAVWGHFFVSNLLLSVIFSCIGLAIGIAVSLILGVSFYEIFNNVQINP